MLNVAASQPSTMPAPMSFPPRVAQQGLELGGSVHHEQSNQHLRWNHPGPEVGCVTTLFALPRHFRRPMLRK